MANLAKKTRERYRRDLEAAKPFLKAGAFPSAQKAEYKDIRRLRRYLAHIGEATSQPFYQYNARSSEVKKAIQREFKPPRLPGLKGSILPVQNWGDRARVRLRGGELDYRIESEVGTLGRRFVRFPLRAVVEKDAAALERWIRREMARARGAGEDALFFQFAGKDSDFTRDPAETVAEEDAVNYVRNLVEDPRYTEHEKWMDGAVFLRAIEGASSARIPKRAGAAKRLDEEQRKRRRAEARVERIRGRVLQRTGKTKKAAKKNAAKKRARK